MTDSKLYDRVKQGDPIAIREYAQSIAQKAAQRHKEHVARTTPKEIMAMLRQIIVDAPEPEMWTDQQAKDLSTVTFVLYWLSMHQQPTKIDLTPEEQQMLDGMKSGLSPFPTPNNFSVLLSLIAKGAFQTAQIQEVSNVQSNH